MRRSMLMLTMLGLLVAAASAASSEGWAWADLPVTPLAGVVEGTTSNAPPPTITVGSEEYPVILHRLRIARTVTVDAYALDFLNPVSVGAEYAATARGGVGLPDLEAAVLLVRLPPDDPERPISVADHAVRQLAIWHLVRGLPLDNPDIIGDDRLRVAAQELVARVAAAGDEVSEGAIAGEFSVEEIGGDLSTVRLGVRLHTGTAESTFHCPQHIDMRLEGVWSVVVTTMAIATGEDVHSGESEDQIAASPPDDCPNNEPTRAGDWEVRVLADGDPPLDANNAVAVIPRSEYPRQIEFVWNVPLEAGAVWSPVSSGSPLITAEPADVAVAEQVVIEPAQLGEIQRLFERVVLFRLGSLPDAVGVVLLLALLYLVLRLRSFGDWLFRRSSRAVKGVTLYARQRRVVEWTVYLETSDDRLIEGFVASLERFWDAYGADGRHRRATAPVYASFYRRWWTRFKDPRSVKKAIDAVVGATVGVPIARVSKVQAEAVASLIEHVKEPALGAVVLQAREILLVKVGGDAGATTLIALELSEEQRRLLARNPDWLMEPTDLLRRLSQGQRPAIALETIPTRAVAVTGGDDGGSTNAG